MSDRRKFFSERHGVRSYCWGAFEWDADWRSRDLLLQLDDKSASIDGKTKAELLAAMPCETAIEYVGGKPGGGKSMYALKMILDELLHGHRPIVTNLAINVQRLQEYVHELGYSVHVARRVYLLSAAEVRTFYLRRTHDLFLKAPALGSREFMDWTPTQDDDQAAGGVMYVIDECHNYFHPQAFEKPESFTPEHPMFQWASQHRKLKDRCFFVTQSIENVHVAVRRLGQQFHYIRNFSKGDVSGVSAGRWISPDDLFAAAEIGKCGPD